MNFFAVIFCCFFSGVFPCSIVFVHVGPQIPEYLTVAVEQARLFNKECPIYLIAERDAFKKLPFPLDKTIQCIPCESLAASKSHVVFRGQSKLDRRSFNGFWMFASERFFYIEELIRKFDLKDVFHLENDVMLYANLSSLLPAFQKHYSGKIGATFDDETRCVPGFVYISKLKPISELVKFMAGRAKAAKNDMEIFQEFKNEFGDRYIDNLPIVIPEYCRDRVLKNAIGVTAKYPERFFRNFTDFQSVFDAAAIGQYLGGTSPRNDSAAPGFINERCVFDPSLFAYEWKRDEEDRLVPCLQYNGIEYRINNLHIHSKQLLLFFSKRETHASNL